MKGAGTKDDRLGTARRQVKTTFALTLSFVVEKADEQILPAGR